MGRRGEQLLCGTPRAERWAWVLQATPFEDSGRATRAMRADAETRGRGDAAKRSELHFLRVSMSPHLRVSRDAKRS